MITVADLTKRFGRTTAVDHLSFQVRPGTVTGFLGPNGSGKSTTMRCMLGLDRPDTGGASFGDRVRNATRIARGQRSEHRIDRCGIVRDVIETCLALFRQ